MLKIWNLLSRLLVNPFETPSTSEILNPVEQHQASDDVSPKASTSVLSNSDVSPCGPSQVCNVKPPTSETLRSCDPCLPATSVPRVRPLGRQVCDDGLILAQSCPKPITLLNLSKTNVLGIFACYSSDESLYLPGVVADFRLFKKFFDDTKSKSFYLFDDQVTEKQVGDFFRKYAPKIVWWCGHGVYDTNVNSHVFYLDRGVPFYEEQFLRLLRDAPPANTRLTWLIFDVCYSGTFVNLKYYYIDGEFYEKISDNRPTCFDDSLDKIIIQICGSTDFETANEDVSGGFLTRFLLGFFEKIKHYNRHNNTQQHEKEKEVFVSLHDLEQETRKEKKLKHVLFSTNVLLDPKEMYLKIE